MSSKTIVGIGPLSPPITGPGIKNRHIKTGLESRGVDIDWINTLNVNRNMIFKCIHALQSYDKIIISASKKVRLFCTAMLAPQLSYQASQVVLIPMGGRFHDEIDNLPIGVKTFYKSTLRKFDYILPETTHMSIKLEQVLEVDGIVRTLPNLRPRLATAPQPKCDMEEDGILRLVYVGRIKKTKGLSDLLNACDLLDESDIRYNLDIYGQFLPRDEYKQEFLSKCDQLESANYGGKIPDGEVVPTLSSYDVFVFPTYYIGEGFPGAVIEAFAAGCAVLATNWNYNQEIVEDGYNGLLVSPKSPNELAEKLLSLYESPEKLTTMKKQAWDSSSQYSVDTVVDDLIKFLNEADWRIDSS